MPAIQPDAPSPRPDGEFAAAVLDHMAEGAFALDHAWRFTAANPAAERVLGRQRGELIGKTLAEVLPGVAASSLEQRCRRILADGRDATFELEAGTAGDLRLKLRVFPLGDGVGVLMLDVTTHRRAEADLGQALRHRQEALAWVDALLENSPIGLAFFDRQGRYLRVNGRMAEINGISTADHVGRRVGDILPSLAETFDPALRHVLSSSEPVPMLEISGETPAKPGQVRHWLTGLFPIRPMDGPAESVGTYVLEITDRKEAEEHARLLMQEVDHRAKNALAVALALLRLTRADTQDAFAQAVEGRIGALARAHTLLAARRWLGADLRVLVTETVNPLAMAAGAAVDLDGPDLTVSADSVQPFALALHEMANNAARFGALSRPGGRLSIRWRQGDDPKSVILDWAEAGGPPAQVPARRGVGLSLLDRNIRHQLRGTITLDWQPEGLRATLSLPRLILPPA